MKLRTILLLCSLLALAGCGWINRGMGYLTGYSTVCVKETGVVYLQFPTGAAVLIDREGKPVACK
jgi:hypothetical protein